MRLVYFKGKELNFGDDLNEDLWPALAPDLFRPDERPNDAFVGLGTIIGMRIPGEQPRKVHVFTSGIGNDDPGRWQGLDVAFWCVRGPLSAKFLGLADADVITDGAILTPFLAGFPSKKTLSSGVLVIPHHASMEFDGWAESSKLCGFELLDPRAPPQEVIARIAQAEMVLTESLHGAILADTYGVAWHAFASSRHFGVSKWVDWLASLGRKLALTLIPAPSHKLVLAFGRRPEPLGSCLCFSPEEAYDEFSSRIGVDPPTPAWKTALKWAAVQTPGAGSVLGYTPQRTAQALQALAAKDPVITPAPLISSLQERLAERLKAVQVHP